jgi:rubrerythrin
MDARTKSEKQISDKRAKELDACTDINEFIRMKREDIVIKRENKVPPLRELEEKLKTHPEISAEPQFRRLRLEGERVLGECVAYRTMLESGEEEAAFLSNARGYVREHVMRLTATKKGDAGILREMQEKAYIAPPEICEDCEVPMEIARDQPILLCPLCHATRHFLDTTTSTYYTKTSDISRSSHERIEHFVKVYLQKFQAKERAVVPDDILERVQRELARCRIRPRDVTVTDVRECVRGLKLSDYYYNTSQIYARLTNRPPPCLSDIQYQKILTCIKAIQVPFDLAPKDRHNFLSYSYCMHKISQLLGYTEFLEFFPILRGDKNKQKHDAIWHFICDYLNWQFCPSPMTFA